ncbi:MAG: hypothetical protein LBN97_03975, partial [Oscillospiraceae bacterium]|nr:hypothetical protein [Oscillospiraceae bacterium]
MKRIAALLLAVLTLTACSPKAPADAGNTPGTAVTPAAEEVSAEATTIRLEKVEGSAELTNDAGKTLTIIDKMPLFNGYGVSTQDESFAYLSLDAAKAAKL